MSQLADLEVDEHIPVQEPVVEHQINEEVFFVKGEPLLPRLEEEAFAEFQQEIETEVSGQSVTLSRNAA